MSASIPRFPALAKRAGWCLHLRMLRKSMMTALAGLLVCSGPLHAQQGNPNAADPESGESNGRSANESPGPNRFWQAALPGGSFMVPLDRIASVSRHKYLLDGAVIVDEVTVDTVGQALARFYFISPLSDAAPDNSVTGLAQRGQELIDKATERTGTEVQNMVVKKYPETTHSKSIEYRLMTEAQLSALYSSVTNAWESGRGRKFTAK
jgi:hypothetical protein